MVESSTNLRPQMSDPTPQKMAPRRARFEMIIRKADDYQNTYEQTDTLTKNQKRALEVKLIHHGGKD
jgi:hypothetical protein